MTFTIHQQDAIALLAGLESASVDLIVTDPALRPTGYLGYLVSSEGVVFSTRWGRNRTAPRAIATMVARTGYVVVQLAVAGRKRAHQYLLHGIVCAAFHGPRPPGAHARHLDGNKLNNAASNLAWGTPKENHADRVRHGTDPRGLRNPNARLTPEAVLDVRRRIAGGESSLRIARDLGVSRGCIDGIKVGRTWR